ncbi:MAG: alpha-amylase family glycosyl hydrolase [Chitinispirillaceae bacterium]|nr:alpha-amylase family glycosyl hydrolase [Chitinispirillaceae bacterium]
MNKNPPLIIYNLFPRFFNHFDEWIDFLPHIAEMGFNAIFLNPFFETGFSGSLYAIKDYYKLNPLFLKKGEDPSDFSPIIRFNNECKKYGLKLFIDLVINHTAFDSVLTKQHPEWYKRNSKGKLISPYAIDPANPSNVTVWGDLASIDNLNSIDKEGLWNYWDNLITFFQKMDINGFRCDAAYQVPVELWSKLISSAKSRNPEATFLAETLGCTIEQTLALAPAKFDYLFNSVKWWNYDSNWAIEQHSLFQKIAPTISFPESHDTERVASIPPATIEKQKSKYAFASIFSKGLLMPIGYEFGTKTRINVVRGKPEDFDKSQWDLSKWIRSVNKIKVELSPLYEEGKWKTLNSYNEPFLFLEKSSQNDESRVVVCVNKNITNSIVINEKDIPSEVKEYPYILSYLEENLFTRGFTLPLILKPADVILICKEII